MAKRVQNWMNIAKWAASGGNAQPWSVSAAEADQQCLIELRIDPEYRKHPSPMDVDGLASAIALGCLAKNLEYAAANDGYVLSETQTGVPARIWDGVAKLTFRRDAGARSEFSNEDIVSRRTDRHRYKSSAVALNVSNGLREIARRNPGLRFVKFSWTTPKTPIDLVPLLSKIEHVRWRNAVLLDGLLEEISFTTPHDLSKIPVTQLGVSAPDQAMLKTFKKFPALRSLFKIGGDILPVRRAVHDFCKYTDEVCFLQTDASEFYSAYELGRTYQEMWLFANKHGVSFQPLGLPLIALGHWRSMQGLGHSLGQQRTLKSVTVEFEKQFGVDFRQLTMGYRIGYPTVEAEKAPRRDIVVGDLAATFAPASTLSKVGP